MNLKSCSLACAASLTFMMAAPAAAVGDMPVKLTQWQGSIAYRNVRPLLSAENLTCPVGQVVSSGMVTGGSNPGGGSQITTIMFNKGAKVVISRSWETNNGRSPTVSTKIDCSV
ncbi:hypothetical protein C8J46_10657 [Sphingomonas sp. PP-F2F-A104-K0414]|nr:hypothetical protein C8J46_10657 [Sphingomonas sp. PP-F2F-A104-K0414]